MSRRVRRPRVRRARSVRRALSTLVLLTLRGYELQRWAS